VQEMLTNARRHGDGSTVRVEVEHLDDRVVLTARNRTAAPGAAPRAGLAAGTGRGLAGIARRAALLGGTVEHGPDEDGGYWRTSVSLPRGSAR